MSVASQPPSRQVIWMMLTNWLDSSFCAIRHRLSPSQLVPSSNESIESSSLSLSQTNLTTACGPSTKQQESPKNKWMCPTCTYLNQTRTSRCAQCSSKRDASTDVAATAYNVQEQIKALSIRGSDPELNATLNRASPMGSTNSLSGSRTNLGAVGARISPVDYKTYSVNKWPCSVSCCLVPIHQIVKWILILQCFPSTDRPARSKTGREAWNVRCARTQRRIQII